jgi:hypothetical protein
MKKIIISAIIVFLVWPGIPLLKFYTPFVVAYFVHDGGR